jgi:probable phosphoglycerate mutase
LASEEIRSLGQDWYNHPKLLEYNFEKGIKRIDNAVDEWLLGLGYKHDRKNGRYEAVNPSDKKVALFAHQGFGLAFLSALLDIPYPMISTHFDMCHTGITAIEFRNGVQYSIPRVLTLSSEAHIFKEGLPLKYNNGLRY